MLLDLDGIEESQGDDWKEWLSLSSCLQGSTHLRCSVNHCQGECGQHGAPGQAFVMEGGNLQVFPAQCTMGSEYPQAQYARVTRELRLAGSRADFPRCSDIF